MNINKIISIMERRGFLRWVPTEMYLKLRYQRLMGHKLDLNNPQLYTEKLQALKLKYTSSPNLPQYTVMADKIKAKEYVANVLGNEYIIPTIDVWNNFKDVNFEQLPPRFVLKTNHDSGGVVVCTDKEKLDIEQAKVKLTKSLRRNFYWYGREPQYKDIKPQIFAEELIDVSANEELIEYKMFCFNGKMKYVLVCQGAAHSAATRRNDFYDENFSHLPIIGTYPNSEKESGKPEVFDKLTELSEKLAEDVPHLRVDWYVVGNRIYFGELTFFNDSGYTKFRPEKWDEIFGRNLIVNS